MKEGGWKHIIWTPCQMSALFYFFGQWSLTADPGLQRFHGETVIGIAPSPVMSLAASPAGACICSSSPCLVLSTSSCFMSDSAQGLWSAFWMLAKFSYGVLHPVQLYIYITFTTESILCGLQIAACILFVFRVPWHTLWYSVGTKYAQTEINMKTHDWRCTSRCTNLPSVIWNKLSKLKWSPS